MEAQLQAERAQLRAIDARVRSEDTSAGCHGGNWVQSVSDSGAIVTLEDGSIWKVAPGHQVSASDWEVTDDVVICNGDLLIDTDETSGWRTAHVRFLSAGG